MIPEITHTIIGINSKTNRKLKTHVGICSGWENIIVKVCRDATKCGMKKYSNSPAKINDRYGVLGMFFLFRIKWGTRNNAEIPKPKPTSGKIVR